MDAPLERSHRPTSSLWLSALGGLIGVVALIGNVLDVPLLTTIVPGRPRTLLVTASGVIFAAVGIALQQGRGNRRLRRAASRALGGVVALVFAAVELEYLLGVDLGLDWRTPTRLSLEPHTGRPSACTALGMCALGTAILLRGALSRPLCRAREGLYLAGAFVGFFALVGHAYGAGPLYDLVGCHISGVALPTGLSMCCLGIAGWLGGPRQGLLLLATAPGPGGILLRQLGLIAVLGGPVFGGLLLALVEGVGLVDLPLILALGSMLGVLSALLLVVATAIQLERSHQAEQASRGRAEELFEHAPEGIFIADLSGRYTDVNSAGCRLLRFSREEILGKTIVDLISPSEVGRLWKEREIMLQGTVHVAEWKLLRGDGSVAQIEVTAKILTDGRWMAFARDLTDRLELEHKLLESRNFLQRVLESSTEYSIVAENLEREVVLWNEGARRSYGYALEEIAGMPSDVLVAPEQRVAWDALHVRGLKQGKAEGTILARRKDGSTFAANIVCTRRLGPDEQPAGVLIVARDLTLEQRYLAEQEFLSRVGMELAACLEYRETLVRVTALASTFLGDLVAIDVVKDGVLHRARAVQRDGRKAPAPAITRLGPATGPGDPLWTVLRTKQPLLLPQIGEEGQTRIGSSTERAPALRTADTRSAMLVPLIARGQLLAVLSISTQRPERRYGADDLRLAVELARRAALSLDNVQLFQQSRLQGAMTTNLAEGVVLFRAADSMIVYANPRFETLFGYAKGGLLGRPMQVLVPRHGREPDRLGREIAAQLEQKGAWHGEIDCSRQDGTRFWASVSFSNFDHEEHGRVWIAAYSDITHRKRLEQRTAQALSEKEVLLKEIHHRVKNNLQVVSSLFSLQRERTQSAELRGLLDESRTRVESIALVHEQLYRSADLAAIDLDEYLQRLVGAIRASYGASHIALEVSARDVVLDMEQAVPCALLVCELVSNAFKHAFIKAAEGRVWVRARRDVQGYCVLEIGDNGRGIPADLDWSKARSLGMRLAHGLARQLRATTTIERSPGTRYTIRFITWKANLPADRPVITAHD